MNKSKEPILPKVIDFLLLSDGDSIDEREGIELVEVYPGRWDININDRPTNKRIRHSVLRFTGDDELVMGFGNMRDGFGIDKPSTVQEDQLGNEIRKLMRKYKFCNTCIDKAVEYLLKAIECHKGYLNEYNQNIERKEIKSCME